METLCLDRVLGVRHPGSAWNSVGHPETHTASPLLGRLPPGAGALIGCARTARAWGVQQRMLHRSYHRSAVLPGVLVQPLGFFVSAPSAWGEGWVESTMPVTPRASMKVLGRTQLLEWVNGAVQGDYDKIEDLADGETTDSALTRRTALRFIPCGRWKLGRPNAPSTYARWHASCAVQGSPICSY